MPIGPLDPSAGGGLIYDANVAPGAGIQQSKLALTGLIYSLSVLNIIGPNGTVIVADSGEPSGLRWDTIASTALQLYKENPVAPNTPNATGTNAIALGSGSDAILHGSIAFASGSFASSGDAQAIFLVARNTTINATPQSLFLDGSAQRIVLLNNSACTYHIQVVGRRTDASGFAGFTFSGIMKREAGVATTASIGGVSKTIEGRTSASLNANIVADTTNGALDIQVTGLAGTTFNWVALIKLIQTA